MGLRPAVLALINRAIRNVVIGLGETAFTQPRQGQGDGKDHSRGGTIYHGEIQGRVSWGEQTNFDRFAWLLRVNDNRFGRLNVHQLVFDSLFRFQ